MKMQRYQAMSSVLLLTLLLGASSSTLNAEEKKTSKMNEQIRIESRGYSATLNRQIEQEPPMQLNATTEAIKKIERNIAENIEAAKKIELEEAKARSKKQVPVVRTLSEGRIDNDKPVINTSTQFIFKDASKSQDKNDSQQDKNRTVEQQKVERVERMRQQLFKSNK